MILPNRFKLVFRIISVTLAGIFLFQQVSWAGDFAESTLEHLNAESLPTYGPDYLQNLQNVKEEAVVQQQAVENLDYPTNETTSTQSQDTVGLDLKGPRLDGSTQLALNEAPEGDPALSGSSGDGDPLSSQDPTVLSITTQNGDIIHYYKNGAIDYIEKKDQTNGSITIIRSVNGLDLADADNLLNADITYPDGTVQAVREGKVITVATPAPKPDGSAGVITYYYDYGSDDKAFVKSVVYPDGTAVTYTYQKDEQGKDETVLTYFAADGYEIDEEGNITVLAPEVKTCYYNDQNRLTSVEFFKMGEVIKVIEYNDGILARVKDEDNTIYTYYEDPQNENGEYVSSLKTIDFNDGRTAFVEDGKIRKITEPGPGGAVTIYDYKVNEDTEKLEVYKRYLCGGLRYSQNIYGQGPVDYAANPALKLAFNLSGSEPSQEMYAGTFYYGIGKTVNLSLHAEGAKPRLYYYCYDAAKGTTSVVKNFDMTIEKGVFYTMEFVWTDVAVNVYLYKSAEGRPETPLYTISDNKWNPCFYVKGDSADITLDPSSSGVYRELKSAYTDEDYPLTGNPVNISEFTFDGSSGKKSLGSEVRNDRTNGWDEIKLEYSYGRAAIKVESYWSGSCREQSRSIPLNMTFASGKTYVVKEEIDNGHLYIYIYEKGKPQGDPVYTFSGIEPQAGFSTSIEGGGELTSESYNNLEISPYVPPEEPYYDIIKYNETRAIKEIIEPDGSVINYKNGLVDRISQQSGTANIKNIFDTNTSIEIDMEGIKLIYDRYGNMKTLFAQGMTLSMKSAAVSRIEKEDGTIIENPVFDTSGNIISATITRPDKTVTIYEEDEETGKGVLVELRLPDGSTFKYDTKGFIKEYINRYNIPYTYRPVEENSEQFRVGEIANIDDITDGEEVVYQKYDSDNRLIQLKRKNGDVLDYYYETELDGSSKLVVKFIIVVETINGKPTTKTKYDKDNNIVRTMILPPDDDPKSTVSYYEYGRIRKVYKGNYGDNIESELIDNDIIYTYTYEYDVGKEITVIKDVKTCDIKRYRDGLLLLVIDANRLVTAYEYNADKKISKSTVTRLGKLIGQYNYSYDGDLTVIEDMDGVKRTYGSDNKLKYLEENGRTYAYAYNTDESGNETSTQKLVRVRDDSGAIANYEDGNMTSIIRPDGAILSDFIIVDDTVTGYMVEKGDIKYFVEGGRVVKEVRPDKTIEYYPNGWAKSIAEDGETTNYDYEVSATESLTVEGTEDNTRIIEDSLQLSLDPSQALLLHFNGEDNAASSVDSSPNNHQITFHGNAYLDDANAKFGTSSLVLDGSGDYLSIPASDDWNFGTSDFTIDLWFKCDDFSNSPILLNVGNAYNDEGDFYICAYSPGSIGFFAGIYQNPHINWNVDIGSWSTNTWYHFALVRSGNNFYMFLNGNGVGTITNTNAIGNNDVMRIGVHDWGGSGLIQSFKGNMDDIRISKGIARWTSNFTPPDSEYHDLFNTSGSFISNPIELNSTQLNTISWNELTTEVTDITIQTRTGNTSNPDDGTWSDWSQALTDPAGSQITSPAARYIQYKVNMTTSDASVTPKLLKDINGNYIKINYTKKMEDIFSPNSNGTKKDVDLINVANEDILRLSSYPDTSNNLLLHFNGEDNAISSVDSSLNNHSITFRGNAHLASEDPRFGLSSLALDGNGDYVTVPASTDWNFGMGDFTVETWFNTSVLHGTFFESDCDIYQGPVGVWALRIGSKDDISFCVNTGGHGGPFSWVNGTPLSSIVAGTWHHVAIMRSGTTIKIYLDGVEIGSNTFAGQVGTSSENMRIGYHLYAGNPEYFTGRMDEIRISKGVARWTSNFTPPDSEYRALYRNSGTFTSNPIELNAAELQTISWNEVVPQGTGITIQTRTGNTSNPDDGTWSNWSSPLTDPDGSQITSPARKYLQYRVNMETSDQTVTPKISLSGNSGIKINYVRNDTLEGDVARIIMNRGGVSYIYNKEGTLENIELVEESVRYIYNPFGKLVRVIESDGRIYEYEYLGDQGIVKSSNEVMHTIKDDLINFVKEDVELIDTDTLRLALHVDSSTDLLLHLNGNSNSYSSVDSSISNHPITFNGNAHLDTANARWGSSSISLNGSSDYLSIPDNEDWNLGNGDFTIEAWVNADTVPGNTNFHTIISQFATSWSDWGLILYNVSSVNYLDFQFRGDGGSWFLNVMEPITLTTGVWHHVAAIRHGNEFRISWDGKFLGTPATSALAFPDVAAELRIGSLISLPGYFFDGYIDEVRISKGIARWTSDFTPPNSEYDTRAYNNRGSITSNPISITATELGSINANLNIPGGTNVIFKTRTGASADLSDGTWSDLDWVEATKTDSGYKINSPVNKYLQYQVILETQDGTKTPSVYNSDNFAIKLTYSYNKSFDATAPPSDILFRDRLTLSQPILPTSLQVSDLNPDFTAIDPGTQFVQARILPDDTIIKTESFKADLIPQITLPDGTIIKYFNNKPISITMLGGSSITDIVLEKYNTTLHDYRVEDGLLVTYEDTTRDSVIVSFTATNQQGDTYAFKNNDLVQVKLFDGTVIDNPTDDAFSSSVLALLQDAFTPDNLTGNKPTESADITLSITKDGKITYFINNKMAYVCQRYDTGELELIVDYSYDGAGNLILVRLPYARDSIERQITEARQQIAEESAAYLRSLADQSDSANNQIRDQVQAIRKQISDERARLQPFLYQTVMVADKHNTFGFIWYSYHTETVEVGEVRNALNQLAEQDRILNEEEAKAYAGLSGAVGDAEGTLTKDAGDALKAIVDKEEEFRRKIIEEEAMPVILDIYRSVLGRDPSDSEITDYINGIDYDSSVGAAALRNTLENSTELTEQKAFVDGLKGQIKKYLDDYLAGKVDLWQELGLSQDDVVALDGDEVTAIMAVLGRQNIHFGRSAFLALAEMLKANDKPYDLKDLARKAILIDIFIGNISGASEGKLLELSMFALSKVAGIYDLTLYNTQLAFDDLVKSFNSTGPVIAHFKNNHFVVVTGISPDGKITYRECNKGYGGAEQTVSKENFEKGWTGYAITAQNPDDIPEKSLNSRRIDDSLAQRIKGSCLEWLWILGYLLIQGIGAVAAGIVTAITVIVTSISVILAPIISAIGTFIAGIANFMIALGAQIFSAIQFVGLSLFNGIGAVLGGTMFGGTVGAGTATGFSLAGLGAAIGKTVVLVGLNFAISRGLEALGVSPIITNLVSSFVTGGVGGLFNNFSVIGFLAGGLQALAVQGVNELAPRLGIDSMLTNIISITAGSLMGVGLGGVDVTRIVGGVETTVHLIGFEAISNQFSNIATTVAGELAYYGVTKAGEMLGVDPRISYLAGIGIRSSVQAGLSSNMDPTAIWNGVINGLLRGGTSIGLQWVYQDLDMDPLLGSLSAAALTGAIEGLLEGQGVIKGVYDTLFKTGTGLLTLGGSGNNAWAQAAYISQVLDFSRIIQERGLVDALETYASGFLHQNAIDNIWKMGGIADLVTNKAEVVVNEEGATVKRVYINPERTDFIDFSLAMDDMVGYKQGNILVDCPIEIGPDGCPTTDNGKVKVLLGGKSRIVYNIKDHNLILIEYIDSKGETIAFAQPLEGEKSIKMNEDNNSIRTGRFYNREKQMIVDKRDNQVFRILSTPRSDMTDVEIQELTQNGVEGRYLDGVTIEYDKNSNQVKLEIDSNAQEIGEFEGKTTFLNLISVNGISNEFGKYTPPTYEQRLRYRLSSQGVDANAIYLLPMFDGEGLPLPVRVIKDMGLWLLDNAGTNILTGELIAKLDREIYGDILPGQQYEPKIMTLFSGSANSFFKAINKRHDYIIRDAIVLGGPTLDGMFEETTVTNPHLDRVFNIWGTKDMFYPMVSNKKYSSNVTPYNIEILGASHFDYFYDPVGSSINARASYFVEELMKVIYNNGNIESFMAQHQASYNAQKKAYIVDPYEIDYNPELEWRNGE